MAENEWGAKESPWSGCADAEEREKPGDEGRIRADGVSGPPRAPPWSGVSGV